MCLLDPSSKPARRSIFWAPDAEMILSSLMPSVTSLKRDAGQDDELLRGDELDGPSVRSKFSNRFSDDPRAGRSWMSV